MFKIEGYVETISSDGYFTIRGGDGYSLEKDGKKYNVFWKDESTEVFACESSCLLITPNGWRLREDQMLVAAKVNHLKIIVELDEAKCGGNKPWKIEKVTLK